MTAAARGGPEVVPTWTQALAGLGVDRDELRPIALPNGRAHVQRWVGGGIGVDVALTSDARRRIRLEVSRRDWAHQAGVPVPRVLAADHGGSWIISDWINGSRACGREYVGAALESAVCIAGTSGFPASLEGSSWRAPRSTRPLRAARLALGGMPLRVWRAARAQALRLPRGQLAHNDFYPKNVIASGGTAYVVDWEHAATAPRHTDELRLWSTLRDRDDRELVMQVVLARAGPSGHRDVGALLLWLSLRLLGENLSAAPENRTPASLAHAQSMLPEASEWARRLGAWPL